MLRIDPVVAPLRRSSALAKALASALARLRRSRWWGWLRRGPLRRLGRWWGVLAQAWRRSLQLRVVSVTLALSGVLVITFGALLARTITTGLLEDKSDRSQQQVERDADYARGQLRVDGPGDPALVSTVPAVLNTLAAQARGGPDVQVAIIPFGGPTTLVPQAAPDTSGTLLILQSPQLAGLRDGVKRGDVMRQFVAGNPDNQGERPFLVLGTLLATQGGDLGLYYLFPLDDEVDAAALVSTSVALTGATLVVLLAVIAGLVTRMVVRPVRVAARTAQRLSAGLLDQRMAVRGEDDLARLAASFNQMAANLQQQIMALEEMSRLQRRFTSDVSHELRTPLTTVRMAADLIFASRDEFDPAVMRSAEILQGELDRFEELLTDLLEISRFDAGFAVLEAEPTDLVPVVCAVVDRFRALAARLDTELVVEVPDQPVIAEVDQRRVERILRNLVGNAVEHAEKRPVRITLACDEHAVAITVRDHGVGLKPGDDKLVFNRFWRADPSRARQTGGTGLGLSISLEDARLHGGTLEVWGAPGAGAQFRLVVPCRAGDRLRSEPLRLVPDDVKLPVVTP